MSTTTTLPAANSHFIDLTKAIEMASRYREKFELILAENYRGRNILAKSETFNKADIHSILNQAGCEGLRIYYGMDEEDKVHAIIVAVDSNNEDILENEETSTVEEGQRCPDICPPPSPMNDQP